MDLVRVVGGLPPEGVVASSGETVVARCKLPPQLHRQKHPTHLLGENPSIGEKSMVFQLTNYLKMRTQCTWQKKEIYHVDMETGGVQMEAFRRCFMEIIDLYNHQKGKLKSKWRSPGSG